MSTINPSSMTPGFRELVDAARKDTYADAARTAVKNDPFTRAADLAFKNLEAVNYDAGTSAGAGSSDVDRPALSMPRVALPADPKQARDTFTLLMGNLIALLGEVSTTGLRSRLDMLKSMAQASASGFDELSAQYSAALLELEAAQAAVGTGGDLLQAASLRLQQALLVLSGADARLAGLDPESPEYPEAVQARLLAQAGVDGARQGVAGAETHLLGVTALAQASLARAEALAQTLQQAVSGPLPATVKEGMKQQLSAAATLSLLMLQFAELVGEAARNQLESQQALFKEMQSVRQAFLEEQSVAYQKQVEAAASMSKIAGCIGKILGGIVMAVGAIVAVTGVITGGVGALAGVAIFAVGLALTTGDLLSQHFAGVSFMAEAMKPMMDHVIMPAVEWMVQELTKMFEGLVAMGVLDFLNLPENFATMAGAIVGTLAALYVMVALVVVVALVGGAAAGKIADQLAGTAAKIFENIVPRLVEHMVNASVETFQQMTKQIATFLLNTKVMVLLNVGKIALAGIEAGGGVAGAGFAAASGVHREQAAKALAEVNLTQHISEQLQQMLTHLTEHYMQSAEAVGKHIESALSALQQQQAASVFIARKI